MPSKDISRGVRFITEGQNLDTIYIIISGSFKASFQAGDITLKKGDVIGLADIAYDSHFFTYTALEDSTLLPLSIKGKNALKELASSNPDIARMLYASMINQMLSTLSFYMNLKDSASYLYERVNDFYGKYIEVCSLNSITTRTLPQLELFHEINMEEDIPQWMLGFYASFREFAPEVKHALTNFPAYLAGFIYRASLDMHLISSVSVFINDYIRENSSIFLQESGIDLFDISTGLYLKLSDDSKEISSLASSIEEMIDYIKEETPIDQTLIHERVSQYRTRLQARTSLSASDALSDSEVSGSIPPEINGSLDTILAYSGISDYEANEFRELVNKYKKLSDKSSQEDFARKLRHDLTDKFYVIYNQAFKNSVSDMMVPTVLKMFFNFGYVDEELAGIENAAYLYNIADTYKGLPSMGIYTSYEWLKSIYELKNEPSRNEFDTDYLASIHDMKVAGKITAEEEMKLSKDKDKRLSFELENMFPQVNKVTFGRLSSFTPVFSESNVIKSLPASLVTPDMIINILKNIEAVDYSAFFRETVYTNEAQGITREFVNVRILPNFILTPNLGTRGVMWQEIEGRKRTTPARFVLSALHLEDLNETILRLTGEYRWEMCKRIQGARWNDVSDRSLTSEYFDYIQFYKKNSELSQDAKEKIKQSLIKSKNSFREMFVRDYCTWVMFESQSSPRLNKIVRQIMISYCPFPYELRQKVYANPIFKEYLERYAIKTAQKLHHMDNVILKIKNSGSPVPSEILETKAFIEGKVNLKY